MSMSQEKTTLLNEYLEQYTPENRINFCSLALRKYRFEKYRKIQFIEQLLASCHQQMR